MVKKLMIGLAIGLVIALLGATGWALRTSNNAAQYLLHPPRTPLGNGPDHYAITNAETVTFKTSDDLTLTAWYVPPKATAKGATLIFVHGWGANRSALMGQAALYHNERGYGALLLDTRNSGDSEGDTSTWGAWEVRDVQAAYNYLLTRDEVDNGRIGLVGKSVGAVTVIRAATKLPDVKVVVAQSAYTRFTDNIIPITTQVTGRRAELAPLVLRLTESATDASLRQIQPIEDVANLSIPILFAYGTADTIVDYSHGEALYAAANEPKALFTATGAEHNNVFWQDEAAYAEGVLPFVDEHLLTE